MNLETSPHQNEVNDASLVTAGDLLTMLNSIAEEQGHISELSLPELEGVVNVIAGMIPAGNVPGLIASGLARLGSKEPSQKQVKRDVNMLFRGMQQMLDHAVFNVFFAGPAQVIYGYQNLLKLTGLDPEAAFPEGTWQFYVDYALREDSARFSIESDGFDTMLAQNKIHLDDIDRMTAWVMSAMHTLHNYPAILRNEWRERVYIRELIKVHETSSIDASTLVQDGDERVDLDGFGSDEYLKFYDEWLKVVPYKRLSDARGDETYPVYRSRKFDEWLFQEIAKLSKKQQKQLQERLKIVKNTELPNYQEQMSIRSFLMPDLYGETRTPVHLENLHIAIVYGDHYYLIPACQANTKTPMEVEAVRQYMGAIVQHPSQEPSAELTMLAKVRRENWDAVRRKLPNELVEELNMLRLCPIILNFNPRDHAQPLAEIRQAERGIGDHALTIFDTRQSFVFDQSHIYFDGTWAAALAEIITNEAVAWASYLPNQLRSDPTERPYSPRLQISNKTRQYVESLEQVSPETSAENRDSDLDGIFALRKLFKQRSDLLRLTVNDLLLLYRAIHAMTYVPHQKIVSDLEAFTKDKYSKEVAEKALLALKQEKTPPAILMPVDASRQNPRDRLYPMSFEVPLTQLNLLDLHQQVMLALSSDQSKADEQTFDDLQRRYLSALAGFGAVMRRAKEIANAGLSASVGTIKLLAHMPAPLQHFLAQVPENFDMLNDIIKGREVFSNVGQVAKSSTLRRFITAKDDNDKKELAWGVLTDADNRMVISLRDFRPHVRELIDIGHRDLAQAMTDDYLNAYVRGLNAYVDDLKRITLKSSEIAQAK